MLMSGIGQRVTGFIHDTGGDLFGISQDQMALANSVHPYMSQTQVAGIAQADKQLALDKAMADMNLEYGYAWQEQLERIRRKNREAKQRLIQAGAIFV